MIRMWKTSGGMFAARVEKENISLIYNGAVILLAFHRLYEKYFRLLNSNNTFVQGKDT